MAKIFKNYNFNNNTNDFLDNFADYTILSIHKKNFLRRNILYLLPIIIVMISYFYIHDTDISDETTIAFYPSSVAKVKFIKAISLAKESIYITHYTLSSYDLMLDLKEAYRKGVKIFYIADETTITSALRLNMQIFGIDYIQVLVSPKIANSNLIIIDGKNIITSQFKYSLFSEKLNGQNNIMHISSYKITRDLIFNLGLNWSHH
jgi:phosphatidylserine/phosphatidylglycerophosphate/cardiolipin synthase-like enzyme